LEWKKDGRRGERKKRRNGKVWAVGPIESVIISEPLSGLSFCEKEAFQEATSRGMVLPMVWDGPLSKESNPIEARFDVVESNKRSS
jgi:hypothetical protein